MTTILAMWLGLGLIGGGFVYSRMQHDFEGQPTASRREDIAFALAMSLAGPLALVAGLLISGFGQYGWWTSYGRWPNNER